ncbi:hypothetical protein [Streptomyces sp. 7N604]|uniref:hypothetical protein n=1 Tax=Streptomyces sp. 7N604 TaxID=3457415 RepID=UPI003FCFFBA9
MQKHAQGGGIPGDGLPGDGVPGDGAKRPRGGDTDPAKAAQAGQTPQAGRPARAAEPAPSSHAAAPAPAVPDYTLRDEDLRLYGSALALGGITHDQADSAALERLVRLGLLTAPRTPGTGPGTAGTGSGTGTGTGTGPGTCHGTRPAPGDRFEPVNPAVAQSSLVSDLMKDAQQAIERICQVRMALAPAEAAYRDQRGTSGGALVEHVGLRNINESIRAAAQECRSEVLTCQPGGGRPQEVLEESLPATSSMLARGVRMHTIYQHTARASPATQEFVRTVQRQGAEVRTLDESFDRLIIFDREVAFIPGRPGRAGRSTAVEIRSPAVVAFLADLFDRAWLRALPFTPPTRGPRTSEISNDLGLAILRHVVAGDTDAVTAQQLGISVRRCQQYISQISARLGSRSRAQLGYLAAVSGLLGDPPKS